MTDLKRPQLKRVLAMDGSVTWDVGAFRDASGGISLSEVFASSPALQREAADAEAERRRVQDCRFGKTSGDAGATIQTTRRKATFAGFR